MKIVAVIVLGILFAWIAGAEVGYRLLSRRKGKPAGKDVAK